MAARWILKGQHSWLAACWQWWCLPRRGAGEKEERTPPYTHTHTHTTQKHTSISSSTVLSRCAADPHSILGSTSSFGWDLRRVPPPLTPSPVKWGWSETAYRITGRTYEGMAIRNFPVMLYAWANGNIRRAPAPRGSAEGANCTLECGTFVGCCPFLQHLACTTLCTNKMALSEAP